MLWMNPHVWLISQNSFFAFTVDESCGKCTTCRIGTKRLLEMLEKITSGRGEDGDIEKLESLCHYSKDRNSLCALGQTAQLRFVYPAIFP